MKRFYAFLLLMVASGAVLAVTVKTCADQAEIPPFVFAERNGGQPSGKVVGATVDLLNLIGAQEGWTVSVQLMPWARCLVLVASSRIDLALNVGRADAEGKLVLSDAYFTMHNVYFYSRRARPQGIKLERLAEVRNYRLCGLGGYRFEAYGIPTSEVDRGTIGYEQLIVKLHLGRCDLFIDSRETMAGQYLINPKLRSLLVDGTLVSQPLPDAPLRPLYFGAAADSAQAARLLKTVNEGLRRLEKTGQLDKLLARYLDQ